MSKMRTFESHEALTSFLYTLMRDHLAVGIVEEITNNIEKFGQVKTVYANGLLAEYAQSIGKRLQAMNNTETDPAVCLQSAARCAAEFEYM